MESKIYYIYKITILRGSKRGCYYIGQHGTYNLEDNYNGSGKIITDWFNSKERINGVDYVKEILCYCNNEDELNKMERFYIGDKYETDTLCLNLTEGGQWGKLSKESIEKAIAARKQTINNRTEEEKIRINKNISDALFKLWGNITEELYEKFCETMHKSVKKFWDNVDKESEWYEKYCEAISKGIKEWHDSLTEEQKAEWNKNVGEGWHNFYINASEDWKNYFRDACSKGQLKFWEDKDENYKEERRKSNSIAQKEVWDNKSEEERKEFGEKQRKAKTGSKTMTNGIEKPQKIMLKDIPYKLSEGWYFCYRNGKPKVA